jgi:AraC-like DNA-binding protein/tetratricopeptide (TPR) repeat protein
MRYSIRYLLFFIFCVIGPYGRCQKNIDSLYAVLNTHSAHDTTRVSTLLRLCHYEFMADPEKNKVLAEEALEISNEINFFKGISGGYRYLALYYWATGDYGEAMKYAYTMLQTVEGTDYFTGIGQAYQLIGVIHFEDQNYEEARKSYEAALSFYQKSNVKADIGYCYNSLGVLCLSTQKFDVARKYLLKSIEIREEINDEDGLGQAYGNLGFVYKSEHDYATAEKYYRFANEIAGKYNNRFRLAASFVDLGELYLLTGNYGLAESHLLKSVDIATRMGQKQLLKDAYSFLAQLEKRRGRVESTLKYTEWVAAYKDSIHADRSKQIANVQIRYETGKKEQAIQLLKRDQKIQTLWKNIAIAILTLMALASITILLLRRYRERKNYELFNLRIDYLTEQNKDLSQKYQHSITSISENGLESEESRVLKKALEVVEKYIADPLFGVEMMAKEIGMSRASLHRKLKSASGISPSAFVRGVRLKRAAALLRNRTDSVTQIAFAVGFEDQSNFSKSFKKQFGVTPSEYVISAGKA